MRTARQSGFTLMELIGAMAIIGILAAVVAPSIVDGIDRAYASAEEENLRELVGALERHVLDDKRIPSQAPGSWAAAIAAYADQAEADVRLNARGYRRRLYVDPQFFSASASTFTGFDQTTGLGSRPYSPRLMLLSNLSGNLPAPPTSAAEFAAIWDQSAGAGVVEGPRVKIQRLNLAGRFHRLLLVNGHSGQPAYALEGASASPVPGAVGGSDGTLIRYVLESTRVSVYASPFPGGAMSTSTIVGGDVSLRYATDGTNWFWERS